MAVDLGTKAAGWAAGDPGAAKPFCGLWTMPGMRDRGRLMAALRNQLDRWAERRRPSLIVFVPPFLQSGSLASAGLGGLAAVLDLWGYDNSVDVRSVSEATVRKAVLGVGVFGVRNDKGRIIKGTGTPLAKAAALRWCKGQAIDLPLADGVPSHDAADCCVVWTYAARHLADRRKAA